MAEILPVYVFAAGYGQSRPGFNAKPIVAHSRIA